MVFILTYFTVPTLLKDNEFTDIFSKKVFYKDVHFISREYVYVVAKVNWRIKYTLAPNFEANVYISPKLQTSKLMCTQSPNLEAKVNFSSQLSIRFRLG